MSPSSGLYQSLDVSGLFAAYPLPSGLRGLRGRIVDSSLMGESTFLRFTPRPAPALVIMVRFVPFTEDRFAAKGFLVLTFPFTRS